MPPVKFQLNPTKGFGGDIVWRISRWPSWWPSWISECNDFSNSESSCSPNASHQVSAQSDLPFWRKKDMLKYKGTHSCSLITAFAVHLLNQWVLLKYLMRLCECAECLTLYIFTKPALVAQFDARQTSDQEVSGLIPNGSTTFFHGDWSWNIFFGHSLPSADSRRTVVSFWHENVHNSC